MGLGTRDVDASNLLYKCQLAHETHQDNGNANTQKARIEGGGGSSRLFYHILNHICMYMVYRTHRRYFKPKLNEGKRERGGNKY